MKNALQKFNQLFVLWVILAGITAYFWPQWYIPLKPGMEYFFALTMFGVGMTIEPKDFVHVFRNWYAVLIGVTSQFTVMPISAFLVALALGLSSEFAVGLVLTGSAPGAMASNVLCYLAGADVAYSISLTTVATLLSPILTPLLTLWLAGTFLEVSFWALFLSVVKMVIIPLAIGFAIKRAAPDRIDRILPVFPAISTLFIAFICAMVIAPNKGYLAQLDGWIFLAAIILNICGLLIGYNIGRLAGFSTLRKRALSIEIGMQNAGMGSVLALKHFNERVALPAVIFVFICIFSASILVPFWSRQIPVEEETQEV